MNYIDLNNNRHIGVLITDFCYLCETEMSVIYYYVIIIKLIIKQYSSVQYPELSPIQMLNQQKVQVITNQT